VSLTLPTLVWCQTHVPQRVRLGFDQDLAYSIDIGAVIALCLQNVSFFCSRQRYRCVALTVGQTGQGKKPQSACCYGSDGTGFLILFCVIWWLENRRSNHRGAFLQMLHEAPWAGSRPKRENSDCKG